ncbi:MAG: transglutaminase family protein [Dokdonella sp.]
MSMTSANPPFRPERVRYRVEHTTEYTYAAPVSLSQQLLHLRPRLSPRQQCLSHALHVSPVPARRMDSTDAFGNPLTRLDFDRPHAGLAIVAEMQVEVALPPVMDPDSTAWERVVEQLAYRAGTVQTIEQIDATRFRFESSHVRIKAVLADYARDCFTPRRPLLDATSALMQKIHREFAYDPKATKIATPLLEVFATRRGVCQDFAHLMLSCLRSLGLAARYVSGYLLTTPPPGKPRLVGSDASHAWVSVFCPDQGWIDFDPTNNLIPQLDHITIAWGRDFGDVSPLRGVILGGGAHELEVRVTVQREEPGIDNGQ